MLTKEEYLKALKESLFLEVVIRNDKGVLEYYDNFENTVVFHLFKQLIEEHFSSSQTRVETRDNPPLKFEEMKEGDWVWDNKIKQYYQISCLFKDNREMATYGFMNGFVLFEENRFYRKQVID